MTMSRSGDRPDDGRATAGRQADDPCVLDDQVALPIRGPCLFVGFLMPVFTAYCLGVAFALICLILGCSGDGKQDGVGNDRFTIFDCRKEEWQRTNSNLVHAIDMQ